MVKGIGVFAPPFLIGGISIPLSNSITLGLILFISQTISFFIVGILTSFGAKLEKINIKNQKEYTVSTALVSSVKNSVTGYISTSSTVLIDFCVSQSK